MNFGKKNETKTKILNAVYEHIYAMINSPGQTGQSYHDILLKCPGSPAQLSLDQGTHCHLYHHNQWHGSPSTFNKWMSVIFTKHKEVYKHAKKP